MVLQNILENAISFSPRGGTITITLSHDHDTVQLQIDDEGPGIPPDKIEHIFERYFSSRPHQPSEPGRPPHSGLGLWMVRRNVEALGGEVRAANRSGGGLTVAILLPRNED